MSKVTTGGGWPAIRYAWQMAKKSGGLLRFYRALRSRNACKTCALGMGGQHGGMTDEAGRFPEVCKKSMQAMAADMQAGIAPEFFATHSLAELRRLSPRELEHAGRLVDPLYAGPDQTYYQSVPWDQALERCIQWLKQTPPERHFFYVSGRSSNEAGFLIQLFARLYGTNNVNNCSYYCHQASGVGLTSALGTGTATVALDDLERCDFFFLLGGNPASNHPRLMRQLMNLRQRGGQVVVVNPLRETGLVNFSVPSHVRSLFFGSPIASHYVQPHIGGDIGLLNGIAKRLDEIGAVDEAFVRARTEGWEALRDFLRATSWSEVVEASGVPRETIEELALLYAAARNVIFGWTMGITHHVHGVDNVRAIVNLGLIRGMVGRPGAGLLPIRGHSNVQGIGSVGVTPALKQAVFNRLEQHFGIKLPTDQGLDTLACVDAMLAGQLNAGWCLGGNLFGASPDAARTERAFRRLDKLVYFSTSLNTGHVRGRARETMILPMLARDEEPQATTQESMFNYVRLSDGGPRRHIGPRSEVETIAAIARGVLGDAGPVDWRSMQAHRNIRQAIGAIVPGYEKIAEMDATKEEFQIAGRTLHQPVFPTPTGRAKFQVVAIPRTDLIELARLTPSPPMYIGGEGQGEGGGRNALDGRVLRLMTIRSEGQFNTVVYEDEDIYRGQDRRDVILMSAEDMTRLGLSDSQAVTVRSAAGEMHAVLVRPADIRSGNAAMYFPEANTLVPAVADPESRTPAFKCTVVTITPEIEIPAASPGREPALDVPSRPRSRLHAC